MRLRRRDRQPEPTSPNPYTPPSYKGVGCMLVVTLVGFALVMLAYSWAVTVWTPPA
jgi:hypothetical protein